MININIQFSNFLGVKHASNVFDKCYAQKGSKMSNVNRLFNELFKKRPFIYLVDGKYYAFGEGVCAKIPYTVDNKLNNPITLPDVYNNYLEILDDSNANSSDKWQIYYKLNEYAETIKTNIGHKQVKEEDFNSFNFTENDLLSIQKQLNTMVKMIKDNDFGERIIKLGYF